MRLSGLWANGTIARLETVASLAMALGWAIENRPDTLYLLYQETPWLDVKRAIMTESMRTADSILRYLREEVNINYLEGRNHV